jgi:hypothetical protein
MEWIELRCTRFLTDAVMQRRRWKRSLRGRKVDITLDLFAGVRYWAGSPDAGPHDFGLW